MHFLAHVFWPAYLAACLAELAFVATIDPAVPGLRGDAAEFSAVAVYSLGFLLFVAVGITSSLLTCCLVRPAAEVNGRRCGRTEPPH